MTLHAADALVGRVQVGRVFRLHHRVAGLPAEVCRIHILNASIGAHAQDDDVQQRQAAHPGRGPAEKRLAEIDFGIFVGQLSRRLEFVAMQKCADRNHDQPDRKDPRKNENENNADIRIDRSRGREIKCPEAIMVIAELVVRTAPTIVKAL